MARQFRNGNCVRELFALAIDQAHEQNNAVIKGDGEAIGLTEDPTALRRWMVAGPDVSGLVTGYEAVSRAEDATTSSRHHEPTERAQKAFHCTTGDGKSFFKRSLLTFSY